ncbi:unnamed protein product [Penicillium pancosmium]
MPELRQRQTTASPGPNRDTNTPTPQPSRHTSNEDRGISVLDIIRVLVTFVIASCGLSYYVTNSESVLWGYRPWYTRWPVLKSYMIGPITLTPTELSLYNGSDPSLPIYLAVNGSIFDVSANPGMYGPGGGYGFFSGRDATRAFVTGCFQEDLTPDLGGVEEMFVPVEDVEDERITNGERKIRKEREVRLARQQVEKTVNRWEGFFRNHAKYFQVGRVSGGQGEGDEVWGKRPLCEAAAGQRPKRSEMEGK